MIATRVQVRAPLVARSRRNVCRAPAAVIDDVRDVVSDQLGVDLEKVTPDAKFVEDLGADSLDTVEMMMALEDKFGIEISDNVGADSITVVSDVADVIEKIQSGELPNKPPTPEPAAEAAKSE